MIDIDQEIKKTIAPLIEEPKVFTETYKPTSPLFRDKEIRKLMNIIKMGENESPINVKVIGPPSTGKTLVVKLLYEKFNKRFEEMESNTKLVYVNLGNSSYYNALVNIATSFDSSYPRRGEATGNVEKHIMEYIDDDQVVGFILDEADRMVDIPPYDNPLDLLLCLLSRTEDKYDKKCFVILIANDEEKVDNVMDERTKSSFSENTITFEQYNGKQIGKILWERCEKGLKDDAIDYDAVINLGKRISSTSKDIRVGLKTLKLAAMDTKNHITAPMVDRAYDDAVRDIHKDIISTLDDTQLLLVYAIAREQYAGLQNKNYTRANNTNVYREYKQLAEKIDIEILRSKHLFNYILPKLQSRGIISSYIKSFGRGGGRKKVMSCADDEDEVKKIAYLAKNEIESRFNQ